MIYKLIKGRLVFIRDESGFDSRHNTLFLHNWKWYDYYMLVAVLFVLSFIGEGKSKKIKKVLDIIYKV